MKKAFIIPAYNEEGAIGKTIASALKSIPDSEVYVCDNNSSDSTSDEAIKHGAIVINEPKKGKGLSFIDTSSAAAECVTLQAAGGFNIHLFPTGQGNIIGNPIEPVVKLTANPLTAKLMKEHVACDVSKILSREMNLSQAGDELIKTMLRVANGRLTCAEALGHREFVMTKLYRSA